MIDQTAAQDRLESPQVAVRPVLWGAFGALILLVGAVAGLHFVFVWDVPNRTLPPPSLFPQPRVRTDEVAERLRIEAAQRRLLTGYSWADQKQGWYESRSTVRWI